MKGLSILSNILLLTLAIASAVVFLMFFLANVQERMQSINPTTISLSPPLVQQVYQKDGNICLLLTNPNDVNLDLCTAKLLISKSGKITYSTDLNVFLLPYESKVFCKEANIKETGVYTITLAGPYPAVTISVLQETLKPNIRITSLTYYPANAYEGETVTFEANVCNNGKSNTGTFYVEFNVDSSEINEVLVSSLTLGECTTVSTTWTPVYGSHTITAFADVNDIVTESDENDNKEENSIDVAYTYARTVLLQTDANIVDAQLCSASSSSLRLVVQTSDNNVCIADINTVSWDTNVLSCYHLEYGDVSYCDRNSIAIVYKNDTNAFLALIKHGLISVQKKYTLPHTLSRFFVTRADDMWVLFGGNGNDREYIVSVDENGTIQWARENELGEWILGVFYQSEKNRIIWFGAKSGMGFSWGTCTDVACNAYYVNAGAWRAMWGATDVNGKIYGFASAYDVHELCELTNLSNPSATTITCKRLSLPSFWYLVRFINSTLVACGSSYEEEGVLFDLDTMQINFFGDKITGGCLDNNNKYSAFTGVEDNSVYLLVTRNPPALCGSRPSSISYSITNYNIHSASFSNTTVTESGTTFVEPAPAIELNTVVVCSEG